MNILSVAYLAPVEYYSALLNEKESFIEKYENYNRQSYRNRCIILSANGPLVLSIPIVKGVQLKTLIKDVKIDYDTDWQKIHWKAIESAYRSSPFYEFYIDDFKKFYFSKYDFLFDFNIDIQTTVLKCLRIKKMIQFTNEYIHSYPENVNDLRNTIHPKIKSDFGLQKKYTQVFSNKFDFVANLSIIDLLLNVGNESVDFL